MAYIGRSPTIGNYQKLDDFSASFNGVLSTFSLTVGGQPFLPGTSTALLVSLGGVVQEPVTSYTVENDQITFATPPAAATDLFIISLGTKLDIAVPADGSVTPVKLSNGGPSWNSSGDVAISGVTTITTSAGTVSVGVGTTALLVEGNARVTGILTVGTSSITLDGSNNNISVGTGVTISSPTSNEFTISTNGSERVRVGSAGTVTIGSSTIASGLEPYAQLQVSGSVGGIVINSENVSASDYSRLMFTKQNATGNEGLIRYNTNDYHMSFWTNADERLRIDASGRVTMPYQPGFVAYMSGSQTGYNMTSVNTSVVIYNETSINTGNHYSTSTGLFTAPVTGWYSFSAGAVVSTGLIADEAWWIINGARNITPTMYTPSSSTNTPKATDIVYLAANDTIGLHLYDSSGETNATLSTNFYHTYFKGYLLG